MPSEVSSQSLLNCRYCGTGHTYIQVYETLCFLLTKFIGNSSFKKDIVPPPSPTPSSLPQPPQQKQQQNKQTNKQQEQTNKHKQTQTNKQTKKQTNKQQEHERTKERTRTTTTTAAAATATATTTTTSWVWPQTVDILVRGQVFRRSGGASLLQVAVDCCSGTLWAHRVCILLLRFTLLQPGLNGSASAAWP